MRVLVTGGSGFIGSHVVDALLAAGHEPRIFDLGPSPYHDAEAVETFLGDVTDLDFVERGLAGCDAAIHLAAVADVDQMLADPAHGEHVNVRGTLNVLEAARRLDTARVVYCSTTWVYSDCEESEVAEATPIPPPRHIYTSTKLAAETYCRAYAELYGVETTIMRLGIPYGPRAREAAVIPAFVGRALGGEPLTIAGDGRQSRRFVYVEDLADGIVRGLAPPAANGIYNLASDDAVSIVEIARAVDAVIGGVQIIHGEARAGDFPGKEISSALAARELGWAASTPIEDGIRRYVEWRREAATAAPRPAAAAAEANGKRILILSAESGDSHDLPARALARELVEESPGTHVKIDRSLGAMGKLMQVLVKDASGSIFRWVPWLFGVQYFLFVRFPPTRWLANRLLYTLAGTRLLALIQRHRPDAVISTHPGAAALLGELRLRRRLKVPAFSAITDLAGLHFWAHRGVDMHFVTHPESIDEVERIAGPGSVEWSRPPTDKAFLAPLEQREARERLGLPQGEKLVVVSGGGWGVGDLKGAISATLETPGTKVICICGRNERARERLESHFEDESRVILIGFTDRMPEFLAAADLLIHSTAGLTVLEAVICGCPVVSYGFAAGHVRLNNRALERFGLATVARTRRSLTSAAASALERRSHPDSRFRTLPSSASFVLRTRTRVNPHPAFRLIAGRVAAAAAATVMFTIVLFATGSSYSLVASALDLGPLKTVSTDKPEVALIVDAPAQSTASVARQLAARHVHGSFTLNGGVPDDRTLLTLRRLGNDVMPGLRPGGPLRWLGTKGQLRTAAAELGTANPVLYVVPSEDFTLGQYLLGHTMGATPVSPAVRLSAGDSDSLHAGDVVELTIDGQSDVRQAIETLVTQLRAAGLGAVPVRTLVHT
jgi:UDP-glucose 4-epimerase